MPDPSAEPRLVTLEDIHAAAQRLQGVVLRSPLLAVPSLGPNAWLKAESLQPTGAFKLRGAYNAIAQLTDRQRKAGVVTHSSGNHGLAVAYAAALLGVRAVVVMPEGAPRVKLARVREQNSAEVVLVGPSHEERLERAHELAERDGLELIPSADDARIIAGQGSAGLEIVEQLGEAAAEGLTIVSPIGGGGLAAGIATAVKGLRPNARVIGVEPALAADARDSLAAGRIVRWRSEDVVRTMADGLRIEAVGPLVFAHLRQHVDQVLTVEEDEIGRAVEVAARETRLVLEPSGAVSLAGALKLERSGGAVVALASGGNVDIERYVEVLRRYHRP